MTLFNSLTRAGLSAALITAMAIPAMAAGPQDKIGDIKGETTDRVEGSKSTVLRGANGQAMRVKATNDKLGDISGESQDKRASGIGQELLNVPMGKMIRQMKAAPSGCVMFNGAADANCDGVADGGKAVSATDYNSSRSNKADSIAAPDAVGGDVKVGACTDETVLCGCTHLVSAPDGDTDGGCDTDSSKATDYNSSRSNKNSNH